ncbi:UvrD-helicase domain-containing protein, partial [Treponema pectinovorum]
MNEEKKKSPLPEQQRAIESIKNTVVAAGAGSGKTTVLSQRFLNLVKKFNYSVDEILTLTFTKKATVEMSE